MEVKENSKQSILDKLYNQDIATEDCEATAFYYHKTLALQCLIAIYSLFSITLSLVLYNFKQVFSDQVIQKSYGFLIMLAILGGIGIVLKRISEIQWSKEKKEKNFSIKKELFYLILQVVLYLPAPAKQTDQTFPVMSYDKRVVQINYNSLIFLYLIFNKFLYILVFLIHCEPFYGSRPDRLSRLFSVRFGTFNAVKYLSNESPGKVIKTALIFSAIVLPLALLMIEGQVNSQLDTFVACFYFVFVGELTVGYGEIVVATIFGRLLTVLIIIVGATTTTLFLIYFVQLMQLNDAEEQALFLFESLQRRDNDMKQMVLRIEKQWIHYAMRCTPEQKLKKEEDMKAMRYNTRKNTFLDKDAPINIRRMMLSNFKEILRNLQAIRQKNNIIAKCVSVIKSSGVEQKTLNEKNTCDKNNVMVKQKIEKKVQKVCGFHFGIQDTQ